MWVSYECMSRKFIRENAIQVIFQIGCQIGCVLDNIDKYIACKLTVYEFPKLQHDFFSIRCLLLSTVFFFSSGFSVSFLAPRDLLLNL